MLPDHVLTDKRPPKVAWSHPCPRCGARLILVPGESRSVWKHPEAHRKDVIRAPLHAVMVGYEHKGFQHQCECESCKTPVIVAAAKTAVVKLSGSETE
jgi:hypothetical protein